MVMLRSLESLNGFTVRAVAAEFGRVVDAVFSDGDWNVRYLVVDPEGQPPGYKILVPVSAVREINITDRQLSLSLTLERLRNSPPTGADITISRKDEIRLHGYYQWQPYWTDEVPGGTAPRPIEPVEEPEENEVARKAQTQEEEERGDPHLRRTSEVIGFRLQATDELFGRVIGFVVEDEAWAIRYLVINTEKVETGRKVLLASDRVETVKWDEFTVYVDIDANAVRKGPEYVASGTITPRNSPDWDERSPGQSM
jgi:hypothetical protein